METIFKSNFNSCTDMKYFLRLGAHKNQNLPSESCFMHGRLHTLWETPFQSIFHDQSTISYQKVHWLSSFQPRAGRSQSEIYPVQMSGYPTERPKSGITVDSMERRIFKSIRIRPASEFLSSISDWSGQQAVIKKLRIIKFNLGFLRENAPDRLLLIY